MPCEMRCHKTVLDGHTETLRSYYIVSVLILTLNIWSTSCSTSVRVTLVHKYIFPQAWNKVGKIFLHTGNKKCLHPGKGISYHYLAPLQSLNDLHKKTIIASKKVRITCCTHCSSLPSPPPKSFSY